MMFRENAKAFLGATVARRTVLATRMVERRVRSVLLEKDIFKEVEVWSSRDAMQVQRHGDVKVWRFGRPEVHCKRDNTESSEYGTLKALCRRGDTEVWRYGGMRLSRCAVSAAMWRYRALEARYRCRDVEAWRSTGTLQVGMHGALELCRLAVGVATRRRRGMEERKSGVAR